MSMTVTYHASSLEHVAVDLEEEAVRLRERSKGKLITKKRARDLEVEAYTLERIADKLRKTTIHTKENDDA